MTRTQTPISIRISPQAEILRAALAAKLGVNKSTVIEMAIRRMAKQERVIGTIVPGRRPEKGRR